ncbi:MAG: valine--tRNA ligase [Sandaracinaceae bacterium]
MSQDADRVRTVDVAALPKHFAAPEAEARWDQRWQETGIYRWDETAAREDTFVVDTPPPTVSGSLHIGHVFSYTHTDILVRQRRMRGQAIFYPMGWDDNGLPTERRVQNIYHVRCDPTVPYDADLALAPVDAKPAKKQRPRQISRRNFIELCETVTAEDEKAFEQLFRRVGLSVDWGQTYATIDERSRHLAQLSFLDLYAKGHLYTSEAPTMWDVDFQTAVAQAEVVARPKQGAFHDIRFGVAGSADSFVISTTRPELLPACVGVTAHPDDERYRQLFGKVAVTPLFAVSVPIFPSELVDPKKGTGILMVCTFGDQTDVHWWREQGLVLREIVGPDGRLLERTFTEGGVFDSSSPSRANRYYAELAGKRVAGARARIVELLQEPEGAAADPAPALQGNPKPTEQAVKHYEKGDRPLEYIVTRQWFVKLMEQKDALLAQGEEVGWHPDFMGLRYRNWTENLALDWCVSRQRYFGVPIPVWYAVDEEGKVDHEQVLLPRPDELPVDPASDTPPGYTEAQRGRPSGFVGEQDVFDTWFTSSLTPQIGSGWLLDEARHRRLFPADIRPQSHEIIRTWAFYTIAKALLHEGEVPWHHVVISGWILDPDRKKMSKSRGNVVTPAHLLDQYTTDGVRYWAGSARLGMDTAFDEKVLKVGKRLVTKLFNAGKFVLGQDAEVRPITHELDRAFVQELRSVVAEATEAYEAFDYARALMVTESFFWARFTDTFLELTKGRARGDDVSEADRGSAVAALRVGLGVLLRLFAPTLPYITEEIWSWVFAEETGHASIHVAPWPSPADVADVAPPDDEGSFALAIDALQTINRAKSDAGASAGRVTERLVLAASPATVERLAPVWDDVAMAARCQEHRLERKGGLDDGTFEIVEARFQDKGTKG